MRKKKRPAVWSALSWALTQLILNSKERTLDTQIGFPPLTMAVFVGIALGALLLDMVTHRGDKPISLAKASIWSIFWIAISLAFAGFLYVQHGPEVASLFVTGYALEKVLSVDNLFVFMAIFAWFKVPGWHASPSPVLGHYRRHRVPRHLRCHWYRPVGFRSVGRNRLRSDRGLDRSYDAARRR
jgi:hypothetical protein